MAIQKLQESPKISPNKKLLEQQSKEAQIEVFDCNHGSMDEEEEEKLRFVLEAVHKLRSQELIQEGGKDNTRSAAGLINFYSNIPSLFEMRRRVATQANEDISKINVSELVEKLVNVESDHEAMKASFVAALERSEVLKNARDGMESTSDKYVCSIRKYSKDSNSTMTICIADLRNHKSQVAILYDEIVFEMDNEVALEMYRHLVSASSKNCQ